MASKYNEDFTNNRESNNLNIAALEDLNVQKCFSLSFNSLKSSKFNISVPIECFLCWQRQWDQAHR